MIYIECANPHCNKEFTVRFKSEARKRKFCSKKCSTDHQHHIRKSGDNWWEDAYKSSIKQLNISG